MDLSKQCANCGYGHHSQGAPADSLADEAEDTAPAPTVHNTPKCPRCNYPIGFPRQRLLDEDGQALALKTAEELQAEVDAAAVDELAAKKKDELIPIAESAGVDGAKNLKKPDLIDAIVNAQQMDHSSASGQESVNSDAEPVDRVLNSSDAGANS